MTAPLYAIVELPKGSRNKYEWDAKLGGRLDQFLFSSVVYPTDYGYFPETLAEDGDPLDAMICVSAPTFSGCFIAVKVISLLRTRDDKGRDDKIVCVPCEDPNWCDVDGLEDLPQQLRDEIAHLLSTYKQSGGHEVRIEGWRPREEALAVIDTSQNRYRERDA